MSISLEPSSDVGYTDYTQGYGCFYFGLHDYWSGCSRWAQVYWLDGPSSIALGTGEQNTNTAGNELQPKPFAFMKLPLEIRYKIYKILVAPLSGGRNRDLPIMASGHGVRFKVSDTEYNSVAPELDFGLSVTSAGSNPGDSPDDFIRAYLALENEPSSGHFTGTSEDSAEVTSDESSDEDQEMTELSGASLEDGISVWHPTYDVRVDRAMDPDLNCSDERHDNRWLLDDCTCSYRQKEAYDSVRLLSHISRQFTRELGECLWQNAVVDFEDPECFFLFVRDHTAALRHINGLVLNIQYYRDCFDTSTHVLSEICKFVSQNLELRFIAIRFATPKFLLDNILAMERIHEWGAIFRSLKVQENFDLCLVVSGWLPDLDTADMSEVRHGDYHQKLLDLWLPDTIRQAKATEEEAYRLSRAQ